MIDIETTGTQPEHCHIIQIAAVKFDLATGTIDHNFFDRCLGPGPNRYWDEETRKWWSSKPKVLDHIYSRMEDPRRVMQDLSAWAGEDLNFWSKPISFDFPFVASYFREFQVRNPFNFRKAMDQNTFIRARHFPEPPPKYEKILDFDGDEHNALHDVLHQIKVVMTAYEATK